jgi:hypothetical protein
MIDPSSDKDPLERYLDNEGLGALLMHPNDQDPLKVYIREDEKSTCLPLELAEQLAVFCHARKHEQLIYFILSQDDSTAIENTLDRRGFLETQETTTETVQAMPPRKNEKISEAGTHKDDSKSPQGLSVPILHKDENLSKVWIGGDDSQTEEKQPDTDWSILTEDMTEQNGGRKETPAPEKTVEGPVASDIRPEERRRIPPVPLRESENKNGDAALRSASPPLDLSGKKAWKRPNYIEVDDPTFANIIKHGNHRPEHNPGSSTLPTGARVWSYSRPRIVNEHIEYVQTSGDLPPEKFVDHPSEGKILPARAHISKSGDCTIFLALRPTHKIDTYIEFLGELFVSVLK